MELFNLLNYVFAVCSLLVAIYVGYELQQMDKMVNDLYKQIGLLKAEIRESKGKR